MEERYTACLSDVEFQQYVMECRQKVDAETRRRGREALDAGHNPACMLTRGGHHCTCCKDAA